MGDSTDFDMPDIQIPDFGDGDGPPPPTWLVIVLAIVVVAVFAFLIYSTVQACQCISHGPK